MDLMLYYYAFVSQWCLEDPPVIRLLFQELYKPIVCLKELTICVDMSDKGQEGKQRHREGKVHAQGQTEGQNPIQCLIHFITLPLLGKDLKYDHRERNKEIELPIQLAWQIKKGRIILTELGLGTNIRQFLFYLQQLYSQCLSGQIMKEVLMVPIKE